MNKYKVKIFYNLVEELEVEAENREQAKEKAHMLSGEGKTNLFFDFIEIDNNGYTTPKFEPAEEHYD
jgi:hypothetical protein